LYERKLATKKKEGRNSVPKKIGGGGGGGPKGPAERKKKKKAMGKRKPAYYVKVGDSPKKGPFNVGGGGKSVADTVLRKKESGGSVEDGLAESVKKGGK